MLVLPLALERAAMTSVVVVVAIVMPVMTPAMVTPPSTYEGQTIGKQFRISIGPLYDRE